MLPSITDYSSSEKLHFLEPNIFLGNVKYCSDHWSDLQLCDFYGLFHNTSHKIICRETERQKSLDNSCLSILSIDICSWGKKNVCGHFCSAWTMLLLCLLGIPGHWSKTVAASYSCCLVSPCFLCVFFFLKQIVRVLLNMMQYTQSSDF